MIPRFSLRSLLLAVTVVAVVLGTWLRRADHQRRAVNALKSIQNCEIGYEFDPPEGCERLIHSVGSAYEPGLLARALGIDAMHSVIDVTIPTSHLDEATMHLKRLPAIKKVYVFADDDEDEADANRKLQEAVHKLRRALPSVIVEEATSCPISVSVIPIVG